MDDYPKAWRCQAGHNMGMVMRDGGGVRRLVLYRHAVDDERLVTQEVEVMGVVEGYVADIRCSVCGKIRTWVPGEEAIRRLLERTM